MKKITPHKIWDLGLPMVGLVVWFLYLPLIFLGEANGANLEVSFLQIFLMLMVVLGVGLVFIENKFAKLSEVVIKNKFLMLFGVFVLWNWLSLIWNANFLRGFLACGIISLVFAVTVLMSVLVKDKKALLRKMAKWFLIGAVVSCVFAIWQMVGEAIGLSTMVTFLPANYQSALFGFARPTAFAQEPQFFANLLIIAILLVLGGAVLGNKIFDDKIFGIKQKRFQMPLIMLFGICLTFATSRGAFLALILGLIIVIVTALRANFFLRRLVVCVVSMIIGVLLLGFFAQINHRDDISGAQAMSKWVNQMTLGKISLVKQDPNLYYITDSDVSVKCQVSSVKCQPDNEGDGYVEASTNERMGGNEMAIRAWMEHPILGIGIGGSGQYRYENYGEPNNRSINYNWYLDILSELGIVGLLLFGGMIFFIVRKVRGVALAIVVAILGQWMFFAGYPNSLPCLVLLTFLFEKEKSPKENR
ncbi:MAG: O-antigen ligase family protein [Candidatus Nomurabacteria bacterium]|jgi:O-antigen ligase|nr:O-antigen ligase family protein [Candidatus Nomurabacteria bacterium]